MKRLISIVLALALFCASGAAYALPIRMKGDELTVQALVMKDGSDTNLTLTTCHVLGKNPDGSYLVYQDKGLYTVQSSELRDALGTLDADIPALGQLETLSRGMVSDDVLAFQENLRALEYLTGTSDGDYGPGTQAAVQAFQEDNGLEPTGTADEITRLLAASLTEKQSVVRYRYDPTAQYAPIMGHTDVDLESVISSGLRLDYDDIKGEGFISNGRAYQVDASGAADLDKYELTVRFGLLTQETEAGMVEMLPVLRISCLCVRQPMMKTVTLKSGLSRGEAAVEEMTVKLEGVYSLEEALVPLTDQMVDVLAGAGEAGELKLRIEGQYRSFDIDIDDPASVAVVGQAAQAIRKESQDED